MHWVKVGVYLVLFVVSFYALSGLDFAKALRKGQTMKAQILVFLMSMALSYLVSQFLFLLANIE